MARRHQPLPPVQPCWPSWRHLWHAPAAPPARLLSPHAASLAPHDHDPSSMALDLLHSLLRAVLHCSSPAAPASCAALLTIVAPSVAYPNCPSSSASLASCCFTSPARPILAGSGSPAFGSPWLVTTSPCLLCSLAGHRGASCGMHQLPLQLGCSRLMLRHWPLMIMIHPRWLWISCIPFCVRFSIARRQQPLPPVQPC